MARHTPTPEEQAAIDLLHARGYEVLRARSIATLRERVRVAEALRAHEAESAEHARTWARQALDEQQRLSDRVHEIVEFAMRNGATVEDLARFNDETARRRAADLAVSATASTTGREA